MTLSMKSQLQDLRQSTRNNYKNKQHVANYLLIFLFFFTTKLICLATLMTFISISVYLKTELLNMSCKSFYHSRIFIRSNFSTTIGPSTSQASLSVPPSASSFTIFDVFAINQLSFTIKAMHASSSYNHDSLATLPTRT